jgi:DNA-binding HxlR family transcriptional regulator
MNVDDVQVTVGILEGKWKIAILGVLAGAPHHVAAIRRALGIISEKVLAEQLRALERAGLIARHGDRGPPAPVMYEMTPHGHTLCDVVARMAAWGAGHRERTS